MKIFKLPFTKKAKKTYQEINNDKNLKFNDYKIASDLFSLPIRGEVKVEAWKFNPISKKNELIHCDIGQNTITVWMKHNIMSLLSGKLANKYGWTRGFKKNNLYDPGLEPEAYVADVDGSPTTNTPYARKTGSILARQDDYITYPYATMINYGDGTIMSNEQYNGNGFPDTMYQGFNNLFENDATGFGISSKLSRAENIFPYFPMKINLGIGRDFTANPGNADDFSYDLSTLIESNSLRPDNGNGALAQGFYNGTLQDSPNEMDTYIEGEIRAGNSAVDTGIDPTSENTEYESAIPSFIYFNRADNIASSSADIYLTRENSIDDGPENLLSFKFVMPMQVGDQNGYSYPYNGYLLKTIGLYSDSFYTQGANDPTTNMNNADDSGAYNSTGSWNNPFIMKYGTLCAKRYISPVMKTSDVSVSISWNFYLA